MVMDGSEFLRGAQLIVDFLADYYENIRSYPVKPAIRSSDAIALLDKEFSDKGDSIELIMSDFKNIIFPAMVHQGHPKNFSIYPSAMSHITTLADTIAAALAGCGFSWKSNPSLTELELLTCDWYGKMLGIPSAFLYDESNHIGGGCYNNTAADALYNSILAARYIEMEATKKETGNKYADVAKYTAYASKDCNIDLPRMCEMEAIQLRLIDTTPDGAMDIKKFTDVLAEDIKNKMVPVLLVATIGTEKKFGYDDVSTLGPIAKENMMFFHVDAAYGGNALMLGRYSWMKTGLDHADAISANPSNFIDLGFDCVATWVKNMLQYQDVFRIQPLYLRNDLDEGQVDLRHMGISLTRRMRGLKVWMTITIHGVDALCTLLRRKIILANRFAEGIRKNPLLKVNLAKYTFVNFVLANGTEEDNKKFFKTLNNSRKLLLTGIDIDGQFNLRFSVNHDYTTEKDIDEAVETIGNAANGLAAIEAGVNTKGPSVISVVQVPRTGVRRRGGN